MILEFSGSKSQTCTKNWCLNVEAFTCTVLKPVFDEASSDQVGFPVGWSIGQSAHKIILYYIFYILAAPNTLTVLVRGQNELLVEWSNDARCANGVKIKFQICHSRESTGLVMCRTASYSQSSPNIKLPGLRPMTKYDITVARYSCDGETRGETRNKTVITRSGENLACV
jgi:hypothetical protein